MERLHEESLIQKKKERRKANEKRTKGILRLQMGMTAPMDIGLDQNDASLTGGADTFRLKHSDIKLDDVEMPELDVELLGNDILEAPSDAESDLDAEASTSQFSKLDAELEAQYEGYRQACSMRDAKFKARQAIAKDKNSKEWYGITEKQGQESDAEDSEDGGYEILQKMKVRFPSLLTPS